MFARDSKVLREEIKIHHTMRIMPEDQNTGGFFLALLKKNAHVNISKNNKTADTMHEKEDSEDGKDSQKIKLNDGTSIPVNSGTENVLVPQPHTIKIEKIDKKKRNGYAVPKMDYSPFADKFPDAWAAVRDMYGLDDVTITLLETQR